MIERPFAEAFADEWIAAWNSHDLDRILSHYTPDFEFSSPLMPEVSGEPSGRLKGQDAIRALLAQAAFLKMRRTRRGAPSRDMDAFDRFGAVYEGGFRRDECHDRDVLR